MLKIKPISSGIKEKEEYYTEDESLAKSREEAASQSSTNALTQAVAHGKGAKQLGLQGNLTKQDFKSLFYGFQPGEQERIRGLKTRPDTQERLAEELTFSATKSVSMTLHLNQDLRLFEAHTEAVKEVLDEIEQRYIQTRVQVNGNSQIVNTGNLTAALIPHHTSRDGDMQLHTHAIVFNGTKRQDGQWRALHNEAIYHQKWLGSLYRQKLANKVQDLGYEIYETEHGFELKGISHQDIQVFSKRTQAIIQKLKQQGKEINPKNRDKATLTTRKAKHRDKTLEEYQQHWQTEARAININAPLPKSTPVNRPRYQTASQSLNSAIAHLSEPSASFTRKDIYEYVFPQGIQNFDLADLEREIKTNKQLLPLGQDRFTTVQALEREISTVKRWMKGQGQAAPLLSNPNLEDTLLNSGQAEAIKRTLTSTDTHQIIHGLSGVGKTTALGILRQQLKGTNVEIRGFSPTIEAAKNLQEELGIKTNTVQHLVLSKPEAKPREKPLTNIDSLRQHESGETYRQLNNKTVYICTGSLVPNQLWIIDEAGMMSANQMSQIALKAESVGARILLVGDKGQNSSVQAGSLLKSLIAHGATTHSISQIIRQQNSTQKQAVELIAHGLGASALELLNNNGYVTEIEDRDERTRTVAKQYLELSPKERKQTLIVTGTNKERLSITQAIRQGLKTEGELGESVKAVQLVSRNLTREQSQHLNNYQIGDYLKLHRDYKGTSLQKGQLYKVEGYKDSELVVSSQGGRIYHFNPAKFKDKQVFTSQEIEIAVGDNLRWTAGADKNKGQINGKHITVASFNDTNMTVVDDQRSCLAERDRGATQSVSLLQPLPVDYNLVSTSYRAQGKSKKRVIVSATNDPTSSLEPFYVKISRQTKELTVYTQNLEKLRSWVNRSNAQQNPVELIGDNYVRNRPVKNTTSARPTQPTESRTQRTARPHRISEQRNQTTDSHQLREDSLRHHLSSESIYRTIDRDDAKPQRKRNARIDSGTNGRDRQALREDSRYHLDLSGYETNNSRYQAENITNRINRIPQQLDRDSAPNSFKSEFELPPLKGLSELATAIKSAQVETELVDSLKKVNTYLEQVEHTLQLEKLEVLADAINEWRLGQDLANAISSLDPALKSSEQQLERLETAVERIQSTEIFQFDLQELVTAVRQWQSERELADALSQTAQALEQFKLKFDGLEELAQSIQTYHDQTAIAEALDNLSETLQQVEYRPELDRLVDLVNSFEDEKILTDSGLDTKLLDLSQTISSLEPQIVPQPIQLEGMKELADVISQHQADLAIASHLEAFQQKASAINDLVENQVNKLLAHLQENPLLSDSDNPELKELVESLEEKQSRGEDVFWQPEYPPQPPEHIQDNHWSEFKKSIIHPDLIELNAESIRGMAVHERLLSDKLAKLGTGQYVTVPMAKQMRRYEEVAEAGGWWGDAGIDALSLVDLEPGEQPKTTLWGCFKPDNPRVDQQKSAAKGTTKYRKYENPASAKRVPFLPQVSDRATPASQAGRLAEQIYQKHGINPTADERKSGFWFVVKQYPQIPITITEGFKKTLSSLSQGQVTIGLTGVNHIYRSKDDNGNKLPQRQLNPEVAVFADPEREFRFAYDQDTKPTTIVNVRRDMVRGIELLEAKGSQVKVLKWNPSDGKGLDDLIANKGASAYALAHQEAISSDLDKRTHYRTEYNKLAKKVYQELGNKISDERLELEIYIRMATKGELADGARVVGESNFARLLKKEQPHMVKPYLKAIAHVAGTYKNLSDKNDPNLDALAKSMVNQHLVKFQLQEEDPLRHTQVRSRRAGHSL